MRWPYIPLATVPLVRMTSLLTGVDTVFLDFIGTLVSVVDRAEEELRSLHGSLVSDGFNVSLQSFRDAYLKVHRNHRQIRLQEQREIGTNVSVSDALKALGYSADPDDTTVVRAVDAFYQIYLESMQLYPCVRRTLASLSERFDLGLVSNFSYSPAVAKALDEFELQPFLKTVVVSHDVGWRKPNPRIFQEALRRLGRTPSVTVFVGDETTDDVLGASRVGMRTVLVLSPTESSPRPSEPDAAGRPDFVVGSVCDLPTLLTRVS